MNITGIMLDNHYEKKLADTDNENPVGNFDKKIFPYIIRKDYLRSILIWKLFDWVFNNGFGKYFKKIDKNVIESTDLDMLNDTMFINFLRDYTIYKGHLNIYYQLEFNEQVILKITDGCSKIKLLKTEEELQEETVDLNLVRVLNDNCNLNMIFLSMTHDADFIFLFGPLLIIEKLWKGNLKEGKGK